MNRYEQLLSGYARLVGLESEVEFLNHQELEVSGVSVGLTLEGNADTGSIVLFTSLGLPAAELPQDRLMRLMLEANAFWVGTGGCTLGLQTGTGAVLMSMRAPLALSSAPALRDAIEAFADVSLLWREIIEGRRVVELPHVTA